MTNAKVDATVTIFENSDMNLEIMKGFDTLFTILNYPEFIQVLGNNEFDLFPAANDVLPNSILTLYFSKRFNTTEDLVCFAKDATLNESFYEQFTC